MGLTGWVILWLYVCMVWDAIPEVRALVEDRLSDGDRVALEQTPGMLPLIVLLISSFAPLVYTAEILRTVYRRWMND